MSSENRNKDYRKLADVTLCCMVSTLLWVAGAGLFAQAAFAQTESMTIIAGSTAPLIYTGTCVYIGPTPLCNGGYSGDGGPATQAELHSPYAVAVDGSGNVYIADGLNGVIREVTTSGTISTYVVDPAGASIAGTTTTAVATDNTARHIYYGDNWGNVYQDQSSTALVTLVGTSIEALATDTLGNLYVLASSADETQYQLSGITSPGTTSQKSFLLADTSGDSTSLGLSFRDVLYGVAVDGSGNVYTFDNTYGGGTGTPTLLELAVAWGTPGTAPNVSLLTSYSTNVQAVYGQALAVDPVGNVYINLGAAILKFTPGDPVVPVIAGTGTPGFNNGNNPNSPCSAASGCPLSNYYLGGIPSPATATDINAVQGIFIDPNGVLYVADTQNNLVREVSNSTGCQECGPTTLTLSDQIPKNSYSYALNPVTHKLYVVFGSAGVVNVYSTKPDATADTLITSIPIPVSNSNEQPAVDSVNNVIYVPNTGPGADSVTVIDGNGTNGNGIDILNATITVPTVPGSLPPAPPPAPPLSIAVDPNLNKAYVAISNGQYISVINGPTPSGSGVRGAAGLKQNISVFIPSALAVDTKNDIVYARCFCLTTAAPNENYSLDVIDAKTDTVTNTVSEFIGASTSLATDSIAVDETSGHVVIAATETPSIHVWVPANSGFQSYSPGFYPQHVVVDSNNEVAYITDGYGNSASVNLNTFEAFSLSQATVNGNTCSSRGNVIGVDPSTDQAYMTTCGTETGSAAADLNLIDGPTGKTIAVLSLGNPLVPPSTLTGSFAVAVDPSSHVVYVENSLTNSINIFNGPAPGPRPSLTISPNPLTFSPVQLDSATSMTLTVTNTGTAPLNELLNTLFPLFPTIVDTQDPGSVQIPTGNCTLPLQADSECTFNVTFTPTKLESFSGSITFSDNALDTPQTVSLSGTGIAGPTTVSFSPDLLNFGPVPQNVNTSLTITVTNTGTTQPLTISNMAFAAGSSTDFSEFNTCSPIAPGASCTITVSYTPTATPGTPETATLQVTDNGQGGQQTITVTGTSVSPQNGYGTFSQTSINFGDIAFNEPASTQPITMTNSGEVALTITGIAVTGTNGTNALDFPESDTCNGATLAQYKTCQINISFMPSSTPTTLETAQIVISDTSPSGTQTIPLSGTSSLPLGLPSSLPELVSADNSVPPNPANPGNGNYAVSPGTAALSSGGQFVAFSSQAINLPGPAQSPSKAPLSGIYLRTTCVGSSSCEQNTAFIAIGPNGAACAPNGTAYRGSKYPLIDSTGEFVAFTSDACQFSGYTSTNANQIYLRNLNAGTTSLVSLDSNGNPFSNGVDSTNPAPFSMSTNAQFFAFQTTSANVVSGVSNSGGTDEVYWSNTCTGQTGCTPLTQLVSQDSTNSNVIATNTAEEPSISPDGRYVAFASTAGNLVTTFIPVGSEQAYLRDTCYGAGPTCVPTTTLISQDSSGNAGNGGPNGSGGVISVGAGGINPAVSAGGRFVAFVSSALNLIPASITPVITSSGSYVAIEQVYLRDTCVSNGTSVCQNPSTRLLSQVNGSVGSSASTSPAISADGRFITFTSSAQLNLSVASGLQAIYEYDTCQSNGVPVTGCGPYLYVIRVNPSGASTNGGGTAVIDATDQFLSFNEGSLGTSYPVAQIYLGSTTAGQSAPAATFNVTFSWSGTSSSINFGTFPLGEPGDTGSCSTGGFGGGCFSLSQNLATVTLTNAGSTPLPLSQLTLSNTQTGQPAPFVFFGNFSCQGQIYTSEPVTLTLPPGASCSFAVEFEPTAPGSYSGTLSYGSNPKTVPMMGSVTGPQISVGAPAGSLIGQSFSYTVTVSNPTGEPANNMAVTIPVPLSLRFISVTPQTFTCNTTITCTGSLPSAGSVSVNCDPNSGICTSSLPPPTSENIVVTVAPAVGGSATETATLNLTNTYPGFNVPAQTASATTAIATSIIPPTVAMSFGNSIPYGQFTNLVINVNNPNLFVLNGVGLNLVLPLGLTFNNFTDLPYCGNTISGTTTTTASTLTYSGGTAPASGQCVITQSVVPTAPGNYAATTGPVTFTGGTGGTGSASLIVTAPPPNTAAGTDISVTPTDPGTGSSPVTITFSNVTSPGLTILTLTNVGPSAPSGYEILGTNGSPLYYNVSTTASYTGTVSVCFNYSTLNVTNPQSLTLWHYVNGQPPPVLIYPGLGGTLNTQQSEICGVVTSLSPFIVAQSTYLANFGTVNVGTAAPVQTLTYSFTSATTLSAVNILTAGASGRDYTDGGSSTCAAGTAYSAGQSCVVTVAFTASAPGLRSGGVTLFAQGNNLPSMTWYLSGIGQSGGVTIDPGTQSTIATLNNNGQGYGSVIDGAGNVYVVDHANSQVIELAAGTFAQSTVVSSGLLNPTAVALDGAGNLYISDTGNNRVEIVPNEQGTLNSADMSTASISGLGSPSGVATDGSGDLYVADATNGDVVEVPAGGGALITVASGLTGPQALAVDAGGNVYVAGNNQVAEYPVGGGSPILMGSGYANPDGVAVDASGAVYVADSGNSRIVMVAPGGTSQATLALTGISNPQSVAVDAAANVYVTDSSYVYEVNRTQAALAFASTNVGSTSAAQTVTVSDAGNQQLTVSNLAITTNFTQVPSGGTDCTSSTQLTSSGQCSIAVAFAPTTSGTLTGTLTLSDNALNNPTSTQTVQLSGAGSQVAQTITFPTIPTQTYGVAPFALNATASSSLTVSYAVTSGSATVSGNILTITGAGSVTVQASQAGNAQYAPATPVSQTFTVNQAPTTAVWSTPAPITYGTPLSATQLDATATPVSAGTYVYTPPAGTVLNAGSQTLSMQFTPSNTNYASSTGSVTLQVNQALAITSTNTTTFTVGTAGSFTVTATGFPAPTITESGTLPSGVTFSGGVLSGTPASGSNETYNITITASNSAGTATQSFTLVVATLKIVPTSVNFGTLYLGEPAARLVTLTNTGGMPITISSVKITAPGNALRDYGDITGCTPFISAMPGTLAAGKSCTIVVGTLAAMKIFSPTASTATLTITDSAAGSPQSVPLAAQVINPQATLSTNSLTFPAQKVGTPSGAKSVTVTNTGNTPLTLGTLTISGNFALASGTTCSNGGTVAAGASCAINVTFTPTAKGTRTGSVKITDNALSSPRSISLSGTGD